MTQTAEMTVINPYSTIHHMTNKLPDGVAQGHFLQVLTLDDWVHIYRMTVAAAALGVTPQEELAKVLENQGIYDLCKGLAQRMSYRIYGKDPGSHLREFVDYQFSMAAHLQEGLKEALTPDIQALTD